ncbi:MAG TPA: superinfection immunity protein [Stellaceae bacterium]|nr:superinfection immunity protein [Stellaceae bacterium]
MFWFHGSLIALAIYLLPSIIGLARGHQSWPAIAVLDLLLGWTGICWIIALIWSLTGVRIEYGGRPPYRGAQRGFY